MSKLSSFFKTHLPGVTATPSDVPFGAKVGSVVRFPLEPVLSAQESNGLVQPPSVEQEIIRRIGKVTLPGLGHLFRFFLNSDGTPVRCLQLYRDEFGQLVEAMYYSEVHSLIPTTDEEQELFTGASDQGLGDSSYNFPKDLLVDGPLYTKEDLFRVFLREDALTFSREGSSSAAFLKPYEAEETQLTDLNGECGLQRHLWFTPYVRALHNQQTETLLITTGLVSSVDGDESRRSIDTSFWAGVSVDQAHVFVD
jgi:hypothetical protein